MPRYFAEITYNGSRFSGWQRQPNAWTVQAEIEKNLSIILQKTTGIFGCGRTDAGVHASQYFFHFDSNAACDPIDVTHRLNCMNSADIDVKKIREAHQELHARFDAVSRSYQYTCVPKTSPFYRELQMTYPNFYQLDKNRMNAYAALILSSTSFFPFCKSNSDAETMHCSILKSEWKFEEDKMVYEIEANRFLRGMVRLIVGMGLRVGIGEVNLKDVIIALSQQTRLEKSWSVAASGLFLTRVKYPSILT